MFVHRGTQEIITDGLLLRRFVENDAQDMYDNWANDIEVTRFLTWPVHKDVDITKSVLSTWIESYNSNEQYMWAIIPKEFGRAIGSISVVSLSNRDEHCDIGYCLGKAFWGQGIATEALKGVISYLFNEVGFERIHAIHHCDNLASGIVMKKAGMKFEGIMRNFHKNIDGIFGDCDSYAILREDINSN